MRTFSDFRDLKRISNEELSKSWQKWKSLVNLSEKDLEVYEDEISSNTVKLITTGSTIEDALKNWSGDQWDLCKKYTAKIESNLRMRERLVGNPFEREGEITNWLKTMVIRGHDPRKR